MYPTDPLISIVTGVISAGVVVLLVQAFRRVIEPWWRSLIYRGCDISGTWYCLDITMAQQMQIELQQHAHEITGSATFVRKPPEEKLPPGSELFTADFEELKTYTVKGSITDRFVHLLLRNSDPKRLGINCYLLEVVGDGRKLEGVFSFYSVTGQNIAHSDQVLYRERSLAEKAHKRAVHLRDLQKESNAPAPRSPKGPKAAIPLPPPTLEPKPEPAKAERPAPEQS